MSDHNRSYFIRKGFFSRKRMLRRSAAWADWNPLRRLRERQTDQFHHVLGLPKLRKEVPGMNLNQDLLWIKSMEWCKKYCGCHQMPERSFFLGIYQFPLCARCTGIALGHIAAIAAAPFYTFKYAVSLFMLPMAIDGTVQYFTSYRSNNLKRVITGFFYGFAFTSVVFRTVKLFIRFLQFPRGSRLRPALPAFHLLKFYKHHKPL